MQDILSDFNQGLLALAHKAGADHAAIIAVEDIPFVPELRAYCESNACRQFDVCWVGPPAIGSVETLMAKARAYDQGLVIQTVGLLEDSFDYEGMMTAKETHLKVFRALLPEVRSYCGGRPIMALTCGCCQLCPSCTYPNEPCRYPEDAVSAVEACGINVNPMLTACGLKYNNGPDTISYVSLYLHNGL